MEGLIDITAEPPETVEDLARTQGDKLLRYAYLLTGSRAAAEDVVQTAYLKLSGPSTTHIRSLPAYARSVILNEHRRRLRRLLTQPTEHLQPMPEFEDEVELRQDLWRALQRLSARQRAVLILRHYEHLPDADIAAVLRCSRSNVRTLAARALAQLRSDPHMSGLKWTKEPE